MGQWTGSKSGKEHIKAAHHHPVYSTHVQRVSQKMPDGMKHMLKSRLPGGNTNDLRYADNTTLMAESKKEIKSLLMKVKKENEKSGLKLNIQKTKIMASSLITSQQIDGEKVETVTDYFLWLQNHCRW